MGFTTGFTGGVTLTLGIAYLTVLAHERNRKAQALALRSQSHVLNSLLEPAPIPPPQTRAELAREERGNLVETAKDRWNEEVENAVRWVQRTDWGEVREGVEGAVARLLGGGLQKSREGIEEAEKQAKPKVQEAVNRSRAAADSIASSAKSKAEKAIDSSKEQLGRAGEKTGELRDAAKARTDRVAANAKSGAQDAADSVRSGGTVDAVRGAVRDTISKGIEKGKEAVGKASAAIGLAEQKAISKAQGQPTDAEEVIKQRYEKSSPLKKTAEEVIAERYKTI